MNLKISDLTKPELQALLGKGSQELSDGQLQIIADLGGKNAPKAKKILQNRQATREKFFTGTDLEVRMTLDLDDRGA